MMWKQSYKLVFLYTFIIASTIFSHVSGRVLPLDVAGKSKACTHVADEAEAIECLKGIKWTVEDVNELRELVSDTMLTGSHEISGYLIDLSRLLSVDVSSAVYQTAAKIRNSLSLLQERLSAPVKRAGIAPAFEWAQSPDSVFINVKFSHKLDTPATLGCEASAPVFEKNTVAFVAECEEKQKTFQLELTTYNDIVPEESYWTSSSVGRATLTLKKARAGEWPRLIRNNKTRPNNMHVWWAMKERYESAFKDFEKQLKEEKAKAKENAEASNATKASAPEEKSKEPSEASDSSGDGDEQSTTTVQSVQIDATAGLSS